MTTPEKIESSVRNAAWDRMSDEELIRHILADYHVELRNRVPEILRLAGEIETRHRGHPLCPHGLTGSLDKLWRCLYEHMRHEEEVVFPWFLRRGRLDPAPPQAMLKDHVDQTAALHEIRRICGDYDWPTDADRDWKILYLNLEMLEMRLLEHIHFENDVLFERVVHGP